MKLYTYSTDGTSLFRREAGSQQGAHKGGKKRPVHEPVPAGEMPLTFAEVMDRMARDREAIAAVDAVRTSDKRKQGA